MLELVTTPTRNKPLTQTYISEQGLGKTSLAAMMKRPIFIWCEDGTASIADNAEVRLMPEMATSSRMVIEQLDALMFEEHDYRSVVIDTVTQLHSIIESEIVEADGKAKSINQAGGGYGAGYKMASEVHRQIVSRCNQLRIRKKMNIVYLAHTEVMTFTPADGESYNRYTLRMHKDSVKWYTDDVDVIAHIKLKTFVQDEKKIASSNGERVIVCHAEASSVAKNRFGIENELPFPKGTNPILEAIKNG